jgi:hypothetical protein
MKSFKHMLSGRAGNGISRCYGSQVLDKPEVIAADGPRRLRMTVLLGTKSLKEIASVLQKCGLIIK